MKPEDLFVRGIPNERSIDQRGDRVPGEFTGVTSGTAELDIPLEDEDATFWSPRDASGKERPDVPGRRCAEPRTRATPSTACRATSVSG